MATENQNRFTVISNDKLDVIKETTKVSGAHSNPFYERLLNFRNLQEEQKKRFSVEDLLKW